MEITGSLSSREAGYVSFLHTESYSKIVERTGVYSKLATGLESSLSMFP